MNQKSYAQYTMINPLIDAWTHDTYDYSQGNGIMTHTMSIKYENVKYYSGDIGGLHPSNPVSTFSDPSHYDTRTSPIAKPGSTGIPNPKGTKKDLQAGAQAQNTLQNVLGAVGQGLVPTASAFLGGELAGSGAYTQQILGGLAPALAGGSPEAARQAAGAAGGFLFPLGPQISTDSNPGADSSPAADPGFNAYDEAGY
jgi:hypothetical protein